MNGRRPIVLVDQVHSENNEEDFYVEMDEEDDEIPHSAESYPSMHQFVKTEYPSTSQPPTFIHNEPNVCYLKNSCTGYINRNSNEPVMYDRRATEAEYMTAHYRIYDADIYTVTYRQSCFRNKNKNAHDVAIISKNDDGIYLEFSFNRCAPDGSKYYSCLGCRKAKSDMLVKDVVRTIHIRETSILSRTDPFEGHHRFCCPMQLDIELNRNYRHVTPQPMHMNTAVVYDNDELIYFEEGTGEPLWEHDIMNYDEVPYCEGEEICNPDPKLEQESVPPIVPWDSNRKKKSINRKITMKSIIRKYRGRRKYPILPKCHICFRQLRTTEQLIEHLQNHVSRMHNCIRCEQRITPRFNANGKVTMCRSCRQDDAKTRRFNVDETIHPTR